MFFFRPPSKPPKKFSVDTANVREAYPRSKLGKKDVLVCSRLGDDRTAPSSL